MAVSLALLTGAVWTALAVAALIGRRRRAEPQWELWDSLRGVRVPAVLRGVADWLAGLDLLGDGYRLALRADAAGDTRSGVNLMRAELAAVRTLLEQLERDLVESRRQSRVLQAAVDVVPLDPGAPSSRQLRCLWWLQRKLHACSGAPTRLRLRIGILRLSARLVHRKLMRTTRQPGHVEPDMVHELSSDVAALTHAVAAGRSALVGSWDASRARLGFGKLNQEAERTPPSAS